MDLTSIFKSMQINENTVGYAIALMSLIVTGMTIRSMSLIAREFVKAMGDITSRINAQEVSIKNLSNDVEQVEDTAQKTKEFFETYLGSRFQELPTRVRNELARDLANLEDRINKKRGFYL